MKILHRDIMYACIMRIWCNSTQYFLFNFIFLIPLMSYGQAHETMNSRTSVPTLKLVQTPPYEEKTLIWIQTFNRTSVRTWENITDKVLEPYLRGQRPEFVVACNGNDPPPENKICDVRIDASFGGCTPKDKYGFYKGSPCVFLSLDKAPGWTPEFYNSSDLPIDMTKSLKDAIRNSEINGQSPMLWISCGGMTSIDIEYLGPIHYYPSQGFAAKYFSGSESSHLNPLIALKFRKPSFVGLALNVECKLWAKNIRRDQQKTLGTLHFELMVE